MTAPLILASNSASRKSLMTAAGLVYEAFAADIDERQIEADLVSSYARPEEIAKGLAIAKALEVSRRFPEAYVIGSDQTLSLGERVFHKPRDMAEAGRHISAFSDHTHHLNCGVAIARGGEELWSDVSIARMTIDRKSTRLNSSHNSESRMPSSA
jgi:septum formation protein